MKDVNANVPADEGGLYKEATQEIKIETQLIELRDGLPLTLRIL